MCNFQCFKCYPSLSLISCDLHLVPAYPAISRAGLELAIAGLQSPPHHQQTQRRATVWSLRSDEHFATEEVDLGQF